MPKVQVNDIEIYYEIGGEGPNLLFISGTGGDLRGSINATKFSITKHFKVLAFDQRGMGQTSKPDKPYTMADYADDAAGLMEAIGWQSAYVIGVSFGGMVAQEFAIRYPEKIKKLVLACTSSGGKGGSSFPFHKYADWSPEEKAPVFIKAYDNRDNDEWIRSNPEEYVRRVYDFINRPVFGDPEEKLLGAKRQLGARMGHDTYDRLSSIDLPVLIIGGKYDGVSPPEHLRAIHEQISGSRLEFFEGGHYFLLQDPRSWDVTIDILLNGDC